ncbi:DUF3037 domain-containing protein [Exiguobacterium undae]|uniref:DUF3037 domain-containing protein n=1 Tax=Exiguobacterium undae TaxID=169177 RepID=UPI00384A96D9
MATIQFTILKYNPDLFTGESINVGIAYHIVEENFRKFDLIQRKKRLFTFDDELDKEFTTDTLNAIKSSWVENGPMFKHYDTLSDFSKYYVNEFHFGEVITRQNISDPHTFIDSTTRNFLGLSMDKSNRLSHDDRLAYYATFFPEDMFPSVLNYTLTGYLGDSMHFDLYSDDSTNEFSIGMKILKNSNASILSLRSWLYFASVNKHVRLYILLEETREDLNDTLKMILNHAEQNELVKIITIEDENPLLEIATSEEIEKQ